jgi:predicted nucleic acid-binding protein
LTSELILIDTSAWIDFFRDREPVSSLVDTALAEGRAALCGMIDLEIRQGLRPGEDHILQMLQATHRIPTKEADYALAGDLLASLRRRGITLPGSDGLIAHLALRHALPLLENDGHFTHLPDLWRLRS